MFQDVSSLNDAFGNPAGDPKNPRWDRLESQAKNILDEYNELMDDGIGPKDINQVRDAISDILVFTLGLAHMAGIPVEEDMAGVDRSNRTKFCANPEQLIATIDKYDALGVEVYADGEYPMKRVKSAKYQVGLDGKDYQKDKMLKSVTFEEPVFRPL
jgi:NTP pyrophosphatase (non-canonical NTP hydrolase)